MKTLVHGKSVEKVDPEAGIVRLSAELEDTKSKRDATIAILIALIAEARPYAVMHGADDVVARMDRALEGREVIGEAATIARLAEIAWQSAELEAAREAIEPFTRGYEPWMDKWSDDTDAGTFPRVKFGDFRRARAVLAKLSGRGA